MSHHTPPNRVAIVGAGPIGIELAVLLKQAGIPVLHFDKGPVGATIGWFPEQMSFFSSNDRIAIAGIPIQTPGQNKCSKEQYLAYLRSVAMAHGLAIRTFEEVTDIKRKDAGFSLITNAHGQQHRHEVDAIVLATGDMDGPRLLGIPGEDLPHVSHYFQSPHTYFQKRVLIVGGKNSAAEAALRCYHAGANVAISYRRPQFRDKAIKYWIQPELEGRIRRGEIAGHFSTVPEAIRPTSTTLRHTENDGPIEVKCDFVLLLTGYRFNPVLFDKAGVTLDGPRGGPRFDKTTMETDVPGIYVAGTATAGTQDSFRVFIENCHIHARRILNALTGQPPPVDPSPLALELPES